jgi:hypothetical protein
MEMGAALRPLNIGGLGGQPPDLDSHEAIDPEFGIAALVRVITGFSMSESILNNLIASY